MSNEKHFIPAMLVWSDNISEEEVNFLFEKKFSYTKPKSYNEWILPPPTQLFKEFYNKPELQDLKHKLNAVKSKLNNYVIEDWSVHTRRMDPSGEITWRLKTEIKAEFVTIAWCKLYECLHKFALIKKPQLNSLHLCEAPGAFITALNHYLYTNFAENEVQWKWLSTTLNPYYEGNPCSKMITDDRFMLKTLDHWLFHEDFTGNIMSSKNIEHMHEKCKAYFNGDVDFITADGSIDCVDNPDCQETNTAMLHFAEMIAALSILANGGVFVLKLFTLFEVVSVSKIFFLNCVFDEVHVFKPATSKRGNSENYIICIGYRKHTKYLHESLILMKNILDAKNNLLPIFGINQLPKDFLIQHEVCTRIFMNYQIQAIESNIYTYEQKCRYAIRRSNNLRAKVSAEFLQRYNIQTIPKHLRILHQTEDYLETSYKSAICKGSHTEREIRKSITKEIQIFLLRSSLNELEKSMHFKCDILYNQTEKPIDTNLYALKIHKGKPVNKLQTSLFVSLPVLVMYHNIQEVIVDDILFHFSPKCIINENVEILLLANNTHSFAKMQQNFFKSVLNAIHAHRPQLIEFINIAFVTHFSVSLLRFLSANIYNELILTATPTFKVSLKSHQPIVDNESAIKSIDSLLQMLETQHNILCFTDVTLLHRNAFCNALTIYNNQLLVRNFKSILGNQIA